MALEADGASGPTEGNAAKAGKSLDEAISAAIGASDEGSSASVQSAPDDGSNEAPEAEVAGDKPGGEKAPKAQEANKLESDKDTGAPEAPKVFEAPKHWPEADRSAFAGLPDDAKGIVAKLARNLEAGFTRKSQELSDKARYADSVRGLFTDQDRQQMAQAGSDEVGVVRYLLGLQRFATTKPLDYVKWAMQNLGVTPDMLGLPQANQPAPQQGQKSDEDIEALLRDPKVSALEAELAELKKWRDEELSSRKQNEQRTFATQVQSIQSAISEFRSAIDDDTGQLKYPHFDTVQRHMGALMDTDPDLVKMPDGPEKLQKAYDMAVWARPDLRQSFIEQEAQKRVMDEQKRANAERAKRATAVKPAVNVASSKPRATSLDDAIETAMSNHGL
jgi:hypothetical protein